MKLAVMQPYFFPYIGYFQLISVSDRFVFYDDVNYIKGGWVNRNRILINGKPGYFNLLLRDVSSFKRINEVELYKGHVWREKLLRKIELSYKRAPFFNVIYDLVSRVLLTPTCHLTEIVKNSVLEVCKYLNIQTEIICSSVIYNNDSLKGVERVIDICQHNNASCYINTIGGQELYEKEYFKNQGIQLKFIKTRSILYKQFNNEFVPNLSVIDVLMFNDIDKIRNQFLSDFQLI